MSASAHRLAVRVYYEDTDTAGIVYYANYLKFAERGRTEMLRSLGVGQRKLREESGIGFAVRRVSADYLKPARLDDLLTVETRLASARGASLALTQEIRREDSVLTRLDVVLACLDARGRPHRLPPPIVAALAAADFPAPSRAAALD